MHACLNALSVGTPAIPLAYSRKFEPLLSDLGWSHTVDLRTTADPVDEVMRLLESPDLEAERRRLPGSCRSAALDRAETALRSLRPGG